MNLMNQYRVNTSQNTLYNGGQSGPDRSVPGVNTNLIKRKICKYICLETIELHQQMRKIRISSAMSVNKDVPKGILLECTSTGTL